MRHYVSMQARAGTVVAMVVAVLALTVARAGAAITVTITSPAQGGLPQGSPVAVFATVSSTFDLATVTARVQGISVAMAPATLPSWSGALDLTTLPYGDVTVEVTATDVFGATATATRVFLHDEPPRITVVSPLAGTVARPMLRVQATCTDDNPGGACRLFGVSTSVTGAAAVGNQLDVTLDMSAADGAADQARITARDGNNNPVGPRVPIYVEASPDLVDVALLGVRALDVDATRFLYVGEDRIVRIRRRSDGVETMLGPIADAGLDPPYGRLTSTGAVYVSMPADTPGCSHRQEAFEWRGVGAPTALGAQCTNLQDTTWTIVGDWGWRAHPTSGRPIRRNFATGVEAEVVFPDDAGAPVFSLNRYTLAGSGALVKMASDSAGVVFVRDLAGVQTDLGHGLLGAQNNPVYDGTAIAYLHATSPNDRTALIRAGQPPLVLGDALLPQYPGQTYQVGGGFVAFTRLSTTSMARQIWRRSPAGVEQNLTPFAADSVIDQVAANGNVTVITGGATRYLATDGLAPPAHVGSELGRVRFLADGVYVLLGRNVMRMGQGGVPVDAGVDAPPIDAALDATDATDPPDAAEDVDAAVDAPPAAVDDDGGGCCQTGGPGAGPVALGVLILGLITRRRSA